MKTPQQTYPKLAKALNIPEIYLKREDLHKYGSHKGRSIPLMIKNYSKLGHTNYTISSSGNAALAAIIAVQQHNLNNKNNPVFLKIFVGENINKDKKQNLEKEIKSAQILLTAVKNPKQTAILEEKNSKSILLRQSTDDLALDGYFELGEELDKIENLQAIFVPVSSGTAAQGIGNYFLKKQKLVQIHIVQTTSCNPMASVFSANQMQEKSIADAIVDKIAYRKEKVCEIVKLSNGKGWIADNKTIQEAQKIILKTTGIKTTPNGALAIAGLITAIKSGQAFKSAIACIIGGM
jgi:threonine dehydratase